MFIFIVHYILKHYLLCNICEGENDKIWIAEELIFKKLYICSEKVRKGEKMLTAFLWG